MRRIYPAIMILLIIPVPVFLGNYMKKPENRIYGMYPPDFCEMNISKTNFHNITIDLKKGSIDVKSLCNGTRSFTPPSISRNVTVNKSGNSTILLINDIIKMGDETHLRRQIVNITVLGNGRYFVVISDGKVSRFTVETNILWTHLSTGTVNRSINMTLLRINGTDFHYLSYVAVHSDYIMVFSHVLSLGTEGYNGSFSFMNIIPRKEINRSLELIDFRFNSRTRTIPEPLSFGYCSPIPMGISGAQPDYGTGGYCVPPPSVSDLYEETKEALRDLAKAYSESSKDISKYYSESSDDMGYLSYVLEKKGYDRYVYGEHKGAVSTGGSMYPCEEQCYKCCSKWDKECEHSAWDKYMSISTSNIFSSSVPFTCGVCAGVIIASSIDWKHLVELITSSARYKAAAVLSIGAGIYACGDCAHNVGEYIKDLSKCCIGEWYDCNCHCVSIRW
ncbi:hypothetical protein [Candidatus Methanodesulfokora washburnensis]|uniref:Uncharacterized protein n=1 Tax=Candidatus Methanodesulfokora washburnensis TaxID=2478471 RepID=A0A3R9PUA5_9CREN|nr:hypothetical protein [Candidatus Methanodesulfokores washburnensis]RSN73240.1 hypothetical protein D6D85_10975 [Candidatus Methanodesulfokores washburnensis]